MAAQLAPLKQCSPKVSNLVPPRSRAQGVKFLNGNCVDVVELITWNGVARITSLEDWQQSIGLDGFCHSQRILMR